MKRELSVVIPAYNEEKKIRGTLLEVAEFLERRGYAYEILVINDGSTDATVTETQAAAVRFAGIRLVNLSPNRGKGEAVKEGIAQARYPYCLFMDADNSTRISEWERFEKAFETGDKVVIASRRVPGARIIHPQPFMRRILGGGYRVLCRSLFGLSIRDFNCGFKAYETQVAKAVYPLANMRDWTFDVEILCLLKKRGHRVTEIPVTWSHEEKKGGIRPIQTAVRSIGSLRQIYRMVKS